MKYALLLAMVLPATFDAGEAFYQPMWGNSNVISYYLFPKKEVEAQEGATRLLVISEPDWCGPCRQLEPILQKLKKQGYDIHIYSQQRWLRATGKPNNLPEQIANARSPRDLPVPTLLFVDPMNENAVLHWATGVRTEKYITEHLKQGTSSKVQ